MRFLYSSNFPLVILNLEISSFILQIGVTRGQSIREEEEDDNACIINSESDMESGRGVVMSMSSLSRSNTISRSATLNKNHRTRTKDVLVTQRHGSGGVESILLVGKSNNRWTIRKMLRRLCKSHGFKNLQVRKSIFFPFFLARNIMIGIVPSLVRHAYRRWGGNQREYYMSVKPVSSSG